MSLSSSQFLHAALAIFLTLPQNKVYFWSLQSHTGVIKIKFQIKGKKEVIPKHCKKDRRLPGGRKDEKRLPGNEGKNWVGQAPPVALLKLLSQKSLYDSKMGA